MLGRYVLDQCNNEGNKKNSKTTPNIPQCFDQTHIGDRTQSPSLPLQLSRVTSLSLSYNVSCKSSCGCGGVHVEAVLFVVSDCRVSARVDFLNAGANSLVFDRIDRRGERSSVVEVINAINLSQQLNAWAFPTCLRPVWYGWNSTS